MIWDTWHIVGWTFSQKVSSPALIIWDIQCLKDSEQKDHSMNQWVTKVFIEQPGYTGSVRNGAQFDERPFSIRAI